MKIYCNEEKCENCRPLDNPVDYMPYKGYKPLYEYKFYGVCEASENLCCWSCSRCSFCKDDDCIKDVIFIDKTRVFESCLCYSDKGFSGHMDFSRFANQTKTFI